MVHIYYTQISNCLSQQIFDKDLNSFLQSHPYCMIKDEKRAHTQASLLGKYLLKKGLEKMNIANGLGLMRYTKYGKPYVKGLNFNISHSEKYIVCALSRSHQIGIDIEQIRKRDIEAFKPQMTVKEWNDVHKSTDKAIAFLNYWTKKEAVTKADGRGLNIPFKSFTVKESQAIIDGTPWFLSRIALSKDSICHIATDNVIAENVINIKKLL